MIFITGGIAQGKTEFAKTFGLEVIDNIELTIKEYLEKNLDFQQYAEKLLKKENCVIVCTEIGCGIVPIEKTDRVWREVTGRIACTLAQKAEKVYRMNCGIAQQIK